MCKNMLVDLWKKLLLCNTKDLFGRAPAGSGSGTVAGCRLLGGRQETEPRSQKNELRRLRACQWERKRRGEKIGSGEQLRVSGQSRSCRSHAKEVLTAARRIDDQNPFSEIQLLLSPASPPPPEFHHPSPQARPSACRTPTTWHRQKRLALKHIIIREAAQ